MKKISIFLLKSGTCKYCREDYREKVDRLTLKIATDSIICNKGPVEAVEGLQNDSQRITSFRVLLEKYLSFVV